MRKPLSKELRKINTFTATANNNLCSFVPIKKPNLGTSVQKHEFRSRETKVHKGIKVYFFLLELSLLCYVMVLE